MPDAMAPTPTSDSANVCWISGAAADSATATRLAAAIAANDSASPCTVRRRAAVPPRVAGPAAAPASSGPGSTGSVATRQAERHVPTVPRHRHDRAAVVDEVPAHVGLHRPAGERLALVERVARRAVQVPGGDRAGLRRVEDDHVGVRADGELPLLRVQVEPAGGVLAQHPGQVLHGGPPGQHAGGVHGRQRGAHARPEPDLGVPEVDVGARAVRVHLAVGADAGERAVQDPVSRARPGRGPAGSAAGSCRPRPCRGRRPPAPSSTGRRPGSPRTPASPCPSGRGSARRSARRWCAPRTPGVPTSCAISAAG